MPEMHPGAGSDLFELFGYGIYLLLDFYLNSLS